MQGEKTIIYVNWNSQKLPPRGSRVIRVRETKVTTEPMASHTSLFLPYIVVTRQGGRFRLADNSLPHSHSGIQAASTVALHPPSSTLWYTSSQQKRKSTKNSNTSFLLTFQWGKLSHTEPRASSGPRKRGRTNFGGQPRVSATRRI